MKYIFLPMLLNLFLFYSCSSSETEVKMKPQGKYSYVVVDSNGLDIFEGIFTFSKPEKSTGKMTLSNEIIKINDSSSYLPKRFNVTTQQAFYDGQTKKIAIDLNPNIQDDNIYITIDLSSSKPSGSWIHSTMVGIKSQGKIKITKLSS